MAEGQSEEAWNHTASLLAMLANCHRDPRRSRAFRPGDFHPHKRRRAGGVPLTAENLGLLRRLFAVRPRHACRARVDRGPRRSE